MNKNVKFYILGLKQNFRAVDLVESIEEKSLNYEICWGITKNEKDEIDVFRDDVKSEFLYGRELNNSEIACNIGHLKMLKMAISDNVDTAIILEDDVVINDFNWVNSVAIETAKSERPTLTLLLADPRLCLTRKSFYKKNIGEFNLRIFSNPSPTSAYLLNRAALTKLGELPDSFWKGSQADFPPIFCRVLENRWAGAPKEQKPIALANVESTISTGRSKTKKALEYRLWYFHKIFFVGLIKNSRYGLNLKVYIFHFLARPLAWKLSRERMPTQSKNS